MKLTAKFGDIPVDSYPNKEKFDNKSYLKKQKKKTKQKKLPCRMRMHEILHLPLECLLCSTLIMKFQLLSITHLLGG